MLILRVGEMISSGMDQVYNLYNEQVYDVADNLATFTYRYGIGGGNFEQGTAIGLFANIINIILLFVANRVTKLLGGEALY
jgi:putative aldouronate transport system permease protein